MKNCLHCVHAEWKRTETGRLHPSGDGKCGYKVKFPQLPASMYFVNHPSACGGHINRKEELKNHCVYWERKA